MDSWTIQLGRSEFQLAPLFSQQSKLAVPLGPMLGKQSPPAERRDALRSSETQI